MKLLVCVLIAAAVGQATVLTGGYLSSYSLPFDGLDASVYLYGADFQFGASLDSGVFGLNECAQLDTPCTFVFNAAADSYVRRAGFVYQGVVYGKDLTSLRLVFQIEAPAVTVGPYEPLKWLASTAFTITGSVVVLDGYGKTALVVPFTGFGRVSGSTIYNTSLGVGYFSSGYSIIPAPEPAHIGLLAVPLALMGIARRRRSGYSA